MALETAVFLPEDEDEKKFKLEAGTHRYSPALKVGTTKAAVKSEINSEAGTIPKKEEDKDIDTDLKLEVKVENPLLGIEITALGTDHEVSTRGNTETRARGTTTSNICMSKPQTIPPSTPSQPVMRTETTTKVEMEGELGLEASVKDEESKLGVMKVEVENDAISYTVVEEEGFKRDIKDEKPLLEAAQVLNLTQTPLDEGGAAIPHPEYHVSALGIPAADLDEPMTPVVKPEPTDANLDAVQAPALRRNLVLSVEPPSLESVMARYKQHTGWAKNIVKKPKKETIISLKTLAGRYEALGAPEPFQVPLPIEVRDVAFTRHLISSIYGGNVQSTFPVPSAKFLAVHGLNDFMCLNYIMHPNAPALVGAPGFYCTAGSGNPKAKPPPWTKIMRLILQLAVSVWQYFGQYMLVPSDALTPQEWLDQSPGFRRQWVNEIMIRQGWADKIRCQVLIRKRLGRLPTDEELEDALETPGFSKEVVADDIYESFARGDHFIGLWGMKCVGYDTAFQERLVTAKQAAAVAGNDVVKQKKQKKPKVAKREMKRRASSPDSPKKRKHTGKDSDGDTKSSNMEVDDDAIEFVERPLAIEKSEDDDVDEVQIVEQSMLLTQKVYTPRGTRSRPTSAKVIVID